MLTHLSILKFGLVGLVIVLTSAPALALNFAQTQTWENPECASGACALRGATLSTYDSIDAHSSGRYMAAGITTSEKSQLKDFAFVQYIQGCGYSISKTGKKKFGHRTNVGVVGLPFQHKTWQVDTGDSTDPIYQALADSGEDSLRGTALPRNGSYNIENPFETQRFVPWGGLEKNLAEATIYAFDSPRSSEFEADGTITISSLRFQTCVYNVSDLPKKITTARQNFPKALHCFEWQTNFGLSADRKHLEEKTMIDPFCAVVKP